MISVIKLSLSSYLAPAEQPDMFCRYVDFLEVSLYMLTDNQRALTGLNKTDIPEEAFEVQRFSHHNPTHLGDRISGLSGDKINEGTCRYRNDLHP